MLKKTVLVLAVMFVARTAHAIPELQLYIEGASWDAGSSTWVAPASGTIRLWAIGNGQHGAINDVKLSVAYEHGLAPALSLTSSTTLGYNGFGDGSTPIDAVYNKTVTDGSAPILGDGSSLPSHGIFGAGTDWQEFKLGNFDQTDSYITDFTGDLAVNPSPDPNATGQINVYEFSAAGVPDGTGFHFDLYDHYYNQHGAQYTFAPFSHDAETGGDQPVPEPGTLALMGMGAMGLVSRFRKRLAA